MHRLTVSRRTALSKCRTGAHQQGVLAPEPIQLLLRIQQGLCSLVALSPHCLAGLLLGSQLGLTLCCLQDTQTNEKLSACDSALCWQGRATCMPHVLTATLDLMWLNSAASKLGDVQRGQDLQTDKNHRSGMQALPTAGACFALHNNNSSTLSPCFKKLSTNGKGHLIPTSPASTDQAQCKSPLQCARVAG